MFDKRWKEVVSGGGCRANYDRAKSVFRKMTFRNIKNQTDNAVYLSFAIELRSKRNRLPYVAALC